MNKTEEILREIANRFPNNKKKGLGKDGLYLYQEMDLREAISLAHNSCVDYVNEVIDKEMKYEEIAVEMKKSREWSIIQELVFLKMKLKEMKIK